MIFPKSLFYKKRLKILKFFKKFNFVKKNITLEKYSFCKTNAFCFQFSFAANEQVEMIVKKI